MPGKLVEMILSGKIGVFDAGVSSASVELLFAAVASAMAEATGTFVSKRQPAGTQPCFAVSGSTMPEPVGSRWTTHQPRALDKMMNVSPLFDTIRICGMQKKRNMKRYSHHYIKFIILFCHVRINCDSVRLAIACGRHLAGGHSSIVGVKTVAIRPGPDAILVQAQVWTWHS